MIRLQKFRAPLAVAAIALLLSGCSKLPTEPDVGNPGATTSGGQLPSTSFAGGTSDDEGSVLDRRGNDTSGPPAGDRVTGATQSKKISRLLGGVVQAGRFKVIVPPLALSQNAVITVHQPDLKGNEVELEISPASANRFLLPVLLVADCSDMPRQLISLQAIWWWNPATSRWEFVLSTKIDLVLRTVTAALNHFSKYKVDGKAGW